MSRNSKAKRDARKKKEPSRPIRRLGDALQPHAQLLDSDDTAIGGVGWRDGEWLLVLGSQVAARSDSAAMALAMLRHVVAVQERNGRELRLEASAPLLNAAGREAAALGRTLEEHLAALEQERVEREPLAPVVTPSLPH
ncbi:hypothetical protein [Lysobacter soli]|uniref:Uncharacterized protein n=1 Tax=Lysobacter soli TaxID=453783 RepID=A0A3D8VHA9_9GAMM|nr:hypothetical protein [Lysobacter soli]QGW63950.1 hypothetical protein GOY17_02870 [Lysobacter soli]RDY68725.1 hypothetical protein DX912_04295 [Lysobacter soli]UTA54291.1 hypothetical protein L3D22_18695 [Lysobacter soli]